MYLFVTVKLMTTQVLLSPDDLKFIELVSPATNMQSVTHKDANTTLP